MNLLAYQRGRNDFLRGVWKTSNPYPKTAVQLFNSWIEGWMSQKNRIKGVKHETGRLT